MIEYEKLEPGARTPWDAVIVSVRQTSGRTVADVAAVEQIAELPVSVPQAVVAAAHMRDRLGLKRIVITLEDGMLWREDWGRLKEWSAA